MTDETPEVELNDGETVEDALVTHEIEDRPDIEEFIGEEVDDSDLFPGDDKGGN